MADNLGQFQTRIRRYLRELNPDESFWSRSFLLQQFNANYRRRCAQLIMAHEGWFTLVAVRDLTADKSTYGFPSGLQRVLKIELVRTDGTRQPLERDEKIEKSVPPSSSSNGSGDSYWPTYRPISNGFILEPTPVVTVTNGIRIEYAGVPTELVNDSDNLHPSFPELFDEILVLDTVISAIESERVHEMGPQAAMRQTHAEWEFDWGRFIEQRNVARERVQPAYGPWADY